MRRLSRTFWTPFMLALGALGLATAGCSTPEAPPAAVLPLIEAVPGSRLATMAARDQTLAAASLGPGGESPMRLQRRTRRWAAGSTIKVAFRGGDERLHRQMAEVAALWTLHGNIGFDFGDAGGRPFRTWSPNDTTYTAQIRIGFDEPGYFSCVGDESVNAACAAPGQASMNYDRLDQALPANWRGIVLHQFGHALGLEHEQEGADAACDAELRWDDEPGYVRTTDAAGRLARDHAGRWPGIYTVLAGPPHRWSRARVDVTLRHPPVSRAFERGVADPASVMRSDFGEWMYRAGRGSRCFAARQERLSALDERGMAALYPRVPSDVAESLRRYEAALASMRDADRLAPPLLRFVQGRLAVLEATHGARRPRYLPAAR